MDSSSIGVVIYSCYCIVYTGNWLHSGVVVQTRYLLLLCDLCYMLAPITYLGRLGKAWYNVLAQVQPINVHWYKKFIHSFVEHGCIMEHLTTRSHEAHHLSCFDTKNSSTALLNMAASWNISLHACVSSTNYIELYWNEIGYCVYYYRWVKYYYVSHTQHQKRSLQIMIWFLIWIADYYCY